MNVSVVICTYSEDMFEAFSDSVESILAQTYEDIELVLVVDGNEKLYERVVETYGDLDSVKTHLNDENVGLSQSRNNALEYVTGDVAALIDDDAVADPEWIEELVSVYEERDAIAVGGKMVADWVAGKPEFLPEEFYWLIGVTHKGFAKPGQEVRNTFGSNISFRQEVFKQIGTFDPELGRRGPLNIQSEETIFCIRMRKELGHGVVYNPEAIVAHKIFDYRTELRWLLKRAFWQGYSKRVMEQLVDDSGDDETVFLKQLIYKYIPNRCMNLLKSPAVSKALQLFSIVVFTATVGLGYGYGVLKQLISQYKSILKYGSDSYKQIIRNSRDE